MNVPLKYVRPQSLDEALGFLWQHGEEAAIVAGGTDLLVELREGNLSARYLVDISRIREIQAIEVRGDELHVGAGVTFSEILASEAIAHVAPVLQRASATIGGEQIRNVATIGGNVVTSSPAGDSIPALLVHEARVILANGQRQRRMPLEDFLLGPYKNAREPEEMVTRLILRGADARFHAFHKVARRKEMAIARLSLAMLADRGEGGRVTLARLALGSATPMPSRMREAEAFLLGRELQEAVLWEAGRIIAREMVECSGVRPSTAYKEKAVQGLLVKAFQLLV